MYQLRRQFLEAALDYYERFLDEQPDDPEVQAELATTRERVARILGELSALEGFGPLMLLSDGRVQEELGVSTNQRENISDLAERLWAQRNQAGSEDELSPEERQHRLAELLRSHEQKIAEVLDEPQRHRLRQIGLQQQGPFAFKRPDVVAALTLSAEQRRQVNEIIESHGPHRKDHDARREPRPPPDDQSFGNEYDGRKLSAPDRREAEVEQPPRGGEPRDDSAVFSDDSPPPPQEFSKPQSPGDTARGPGDPPREPLGGFNSRGPREFGGHHRGPKGPGDGTRFRGPGNMRETMNRTVEDITQVLTPAQRIAWADLIGKPVTYDLQYAPDDSFLW